MIKELSKLFFTANILVFGLLVSYKFYGYMSYVAEPQYKIRTVDGVYYSSKFKHYGSSVTFLQDGVMVQKSQKDLQGTIIERIK
jgi:hypothetical protein